MSLVKSTSADKTSTTALPFVVVCLSVMFSAALLAGWLPIAFSIVTVFLCAGPHNWLEARYMLSRMPAKWGPLAGYFLLGLGGVLTLSCATWSLPWWADGFQWEREEWLTAIACWLSAVCGWTVTLILLRSRQNPRRDWGWAIPAGLLVIAVVWMWPLQSSLALVYLHPCMGLWFLDRELGRLQSSWRVAYRGCLCVVPICLLALAVQLAAAPDLPGDDALRQAITSHAGGDLLEGVSTHLLVACHTFLEMLHYGVWIVAIPLLSVKQWPWQTTGIPLARRSSAWQVGLQGLLATGLIVVLILWGGFLFDYTTTRYLYFNLAMIHVLAEIPFILRLL